MNASQLSSPRLRVLYRLDGGPQARERTLELDGYMRSKPVRVCNAAADQLQLDPRVEPEPEDASARPAS